MSAETFEAGRHDSQSVEDMIHAVGAGDDETAAACFLEIVNATLDKMPPNLDMQGEEIARLEGEVDRMIEPFMAHPVAAIKAEFAMLKELHRERLLVEPLQLGGTQTEFGTRDPKTDQLDHYFRILNFPSGKQWDIDETTFGGRLDQPCTIMVQDEELVMRQKYYDHGVYKYRELDPDGDGKKILEMFFKDTILAAHLRYTRDADGVAEADRKAKKALIAKKQHLSDRGSA